MVYYEELRDSIYHNLILITIKNLRHVVSLAPLMKLAERIRLYCGPRVKC